MWFPMPLSPSALAGFASRCEICSLERTRRDVKPAPATPACQSLSYSSPENLLGSRMDVSELKGYCVCVLNAGRAGVSCSGVGPCPWLPAGVGVGLFSVQCYPDYSGPDYPVQGFTGFRPLLHFKGFLTLGMLMLSCY